jgi:8-oxo-dGTP pyrophosphatase MutT (NUDIX family)
MTHQVKRLHTAGLIALKREKVLLAFSNHKKAWYLPGGKIDSGETPREALCREISEELHTALDPSLLRYVGHITAPAWGEPPHVLMEQVCFRYDLQQDVKPGGEIGGLRYFDWTAYRLEEAQVPGVLQVFEWIQSGRLDPIGSGSTEAADQ